MTASPLGRYAAIVTAVVCVGIIATCLIAHVLGRSDGFLDGLALAAFGLIAGGAGGLTMLNGTVARTTAQDQDIQALRNQAAEHSAAIASLRGDRPPGGGA